MKRAFALLLSSSLVLSLVLTGCTGGSKGGTAPAGSPQQAASGEVKELNVELGPSPETMDPALNSAVDVSNMIVHSFECLLKNDREGNIIPGVAQSYEVSDDGLTYTFHLREGLKWSDGSPLGADDFVYSWKRVADPDTAAPYGYDLLSFVKGFDEADAGDVDALGVSAPDPNTFVVELASPCTFFDKICAFSVLSPVQQATVEANGDAWCINPDTYITNGAYIMTEYTDGAQIVFEKNPEYYDADAITFDRIVWHLMEDPNAAYAAYQNGEVQMIRDVPTEEISSLEGSSEFHIEPIMGTYFVSFNVEKPPFDDARVREALSLAIDRKYVAESIMQGTFAPAVNYVGPGISDVAEGSSFEAVTKEKSGEHFNVENYGADLEKAKALLEEAGYPGGAGFPEISYLTIDSGYHKSVAEYIQSAWAELGITVNVNVQEWKTFIADVAEGNYEVARNGWACDWDDPANLINLYETDNGNNDSRYSNPEFDALVEASRTTTDRAVHYEKLHEAEQILLRDAVVAPVAYFEDFWLQSDSLKGTWHSPYGYWYFMYGSIE